MSNPVFFLVGLDVSAQTFDVAFEGVDGRIHRATCENSWKGFKALWSLLNAGKRSVRVVMEATGTYGHDLGVFLTKKGAEVMMANPRAVRNFASACLERSKTDEVDAVVALEFARRMKFLPWIPPSQSAWHLRECSRRIAMLVKMRTEEKNRLHAGSRVRGNSSIVRADTLHHIAVLDKRIDRLRKDALSKIREDKELYRRYRLIRSIKGFGDTTAITLLGELSLLPADLDARQWVAYAGLDPRQHESGTSVHKRPRMSRMGNAHLRDALFMPCLSTLRWIPEVRAFVDALTARGKATKQAIVAVMRKMLHCIWGMWKNNEPFDRARFYRAESRQQTPEQPPIAASPAAGDGLVNAAGGGLGAALDNPAPAAKPIDRRLLLARLSRLRTYRLLA